MFAKSLIALVILAGPALADDLAVTPETRKAMEDAVREMSERNNRGLSPAEMRKAVREWCFRSDREPTLSTCRREVAWTRSVLERAARPGFTGNLGSRVVACSDYCRARYPKLPGY